MTETHVLWFRRDLRLHDHPALAAAAGDGGGSGGRRLAPLFVLDDALLAGAAPNRVWFMLETLHELARDLEARGSRLHVRRGRPERVLPAFAAEVGARNVHVSRDYAPYGRRRDRAVAERLAAAGIGFHRHPGVLVHEPEAVEATSGRGFLVYGPFRRAWEALADRAVLGAPAGPLPPPPSVDGGTLPRPAPPTADPARLPRPGEAAARQRLASWLEAGPDAGADVGIDAYDRTRDRLDDEDGTSRLSQDVRFGLLSASEVLARAAGPGEGRRRFRAELGWRDFYAHLLWHRPELLRDALHPGAERMVGPGDPVHVEAWREGRTGYPVVDAAMRQLLATGWMPNRARMIVASFLTRHLLVDRRVGEAHFWRHLVDGDPASNNGGWQWVAGTGTDAQPWFRIFNPVLQGRRFDPDGSWVRRWVPELADMPSEHVHAPWEAARPPRGYPAPIVDHAAARARALAAPPGEQSGDQPGARRPSQPASPRRTS